jgi:hypothetical protein
MMMDCTFDALEHKLQPRPVVPRGADCHMTCPDARNVVAGCCAQGCAEAAGCKHANDQLRRVQLFVLGNATLVAPVIEADPRTVVPNNCPQGPGAVDHLHCLQRNVRQWYPASGCGCCEQWLGGVGEKQGKRGHRPVKGLCMQPYALARAGEDRCRGHA